MGDTATAACRAAFARHGEHWPVSYTAKNCKTKTMRIWDLPPRRLCRAHLLGEHRELHAIWTVLTQNKRGYSRHPETLRWKGKLRALYRRHAAQVTEMHRRHYQHHSPLDDRLATGRARQDIWIDQPRRQVELLRAKGCDCR